MPGLRSTVKISNPLDLNVPSPCMLYCSMITTRVCHPSNTLRISFKDRITVEELDAFVRELPSIMQSLRPRFIMLSDLTLLESFDFDCVRSLGYLMQCSVKAGLGGEVRVVPDPSRDIGFAILSVFHYPPSLPVKVFDSLSKAESYIASLPKVSVYSQTSAEQEMSEFLRFLKFDQAEKQERRKSHQHSHYQEAVG